jgi:predicted ATPase
MTSIAHLLRGEPASALRSADQSLEISREQRFSLYVILSTISRGRALGELGRLGEAATEMQTGIAEARRTGVGMMHPMIQGWLADLHAQSGEKEIALSIVEQILSEIGDATGKSWESELHRQRAQLLLELHPSKTAEAEADLKRAVEVAGAQNAKALELRAATSLAKLLEPIYRWFEEGSDTTDLRRARDLLMALR